MARHTPTAHDEAFLSSSDPRSPFRFVLLWLAGIDLRLTLLAVPPVLPLIHRDTSRSARRRSPP